MATVNSFPIETKTLSELTPSTTLEDTDLIHLDQGGVDKHITGEVSKQSHGGIIPWTNSFSFLQRGYCDRNGVLYRAKQAHSGQDPELDVTEIYWEEVVATESASEIKSLYESNSNTNEFSDAEQTKLAGIDKTELKSGRKNAIINGNFSINQRVVSGTVVLASGEYGHDRFKGGSSGCTYTFSTTANVTTITISAGTLRQEIEGLNLLSGSYVLSWSGTAQGQLNNGGFGATGVNAILFGGANSVVEFNAGTLSLVQLEKGNYATDFEQRSISEEITLCQRYYQKSYDLDTPAGTPTVVGYVGDNANGTQAANLSINITFNTRMRSIPSISLYSSATGAVGKLRGGGTDINCLAQGVGEGGTLIVNTDPIIDINLYTGHYTADAEL